MSWQSVNIFIGHAESATLQAGFLSESRILTFSLLDCAVIRMGI